MPASRTTWAPSARSRTWSTLATSQPARATSQRPGSTARRAGRRSAGRTASSAGISAANRAGVGTAAPTGNPPPTSSVSNDGSPPPSSARSASDRRTPSRHASTVRSPDPTWRWMPRHANGPSGPPPASMAAASSSSRIPNLLAQAPTARPACVSGLTSGFRRRSTSGRGRPGRPTPARRAYPASVAASTPDSMAIQRSGSPSAAARTAARRSASVLPIPSSVIRPFGTPARRATVHSPRETTLAPRPPGASGAVSRVTIAATSFALSE